MKILNIEIINFKPYDTIKIPQKGNLDDGMFFVKGKNSMGKTSFIESILWCLLGEQIMLEKDKKSIIKVGKSKCEVVLTFEIENIIYRIIRSIQKINKRSENHGTFEYKSSAILFKKEHDRYILVCNGTSSVNKEVEFLLGVNPEIIEKTIYIRQKEVDRLALADPSDLRELIKELFGLNEFDREIKEKFRNNITDLNENIKDLKIKLGTLASEKNEFEREKEILKLKLDRLEKLEEELEIEREISKKFPSRQILERIKSNSDELKKLQIEYQSLEKLINKDIEICNVQKLNISKLETKIAKISNDIKILEKKIEKHPPVEEIMKLKNIFNNMNESKKQLNEIISSNNYFLNLTFTDLICNDNNYSNILEIKNEIVKQIQELKENLKINLRKLDLNKNKLISEQTLAKIKNDSIKFIENNSKCPICENNLNNVKLTIKKLNDECENLTRNKNEIIQENNMIQTEKDKFELELIEKDKLINKLELIEPIIQIVNEKNFEYYDIVNKFLEEFNIDLIDRISNQFLDDMISQIYKLKNSNSNNISLVETYIHEKENETKRLKDIENQLMNNKSNLINLNKTITLLSSKITIDLKKMEVSNESSLCNKYQCKNLDELILKISNHQLALQHKSSIYETLKEDIRSLETNIENRKNKINELLKSEKEIIKKEKDLKHFQFLTGEIDGFISSEIIEKKLSSILVKTTNHYLIPFTENRYKIESLSSTIRKSKNRISHGLAFSIYDLKDNIIKTKNQLSGGDESVLGLALRIAISKLISTIRPFKEIEKKIPLINTIIMDEPLASIDESRRNIIMNYLINDKNFTQIFLISHSDIEFKDKTITIQDNEDNEKLIELSN